MDPDTARARRVALTILDPRRMRGPIRDELQHRWSHAANVSHPGLLTPLDFGNERDLMYVAVPWLDGFNLQTVSAVLRAQGTRPDVRVVASLGLALVEPLAAIHLMSDPQAPGESLVHGRLAPSRVMISAAGHVTLLGFAGTPNGVTRIIAPPAELHLRAFLAPEQHRSELPGSETDVWSLALLLLWFATGKLPTGGQSAADVAELAQHRIDPAALGCPEGLAEILATALDPDRAARPHSVRWLGAKLEQLLRGAGGAMAASEWRVLMEELGDVPHEASPEEEASIAELEAVLLSEVDENDPMLELPEDTSGIALPPPPPGGPAPRHRMEYRHAVVTGVIGLAVWGAIVAWGARTDQVPGTPRHDVVAGAAVAAPVDAAPTHAVVQAVAAPDVAPVVPSAAVKPSSGSADARPAPTGRSGFLTVRSTPPGVVYVDGEAVGTTPLTSHALAVASHDVEVRLGGHESGTRTVNIRAGATEELDFTLSRRSSDDAGGNGTITVTSKPPAVVYIDGEAVGTTPLQTHSLVSGRHSVELRLGGHAPVTRSVDVGAGAHVDVDIDLSSAQ